MVGHLGQVRILELLALPKVEIFLEWLTCANLPVHYQANDRHYLSIFDIFNASLADARQPQLDRWEFLSTRPARLSDRYEGAMSPFARSYTEGSFPKSFPKPATAEY